MGYQIYKNVDGQLMRLVYPVSGNGSLDFDDLQSAIKHLNTITNNKSFDSSVTQYAILDKRKKIIYVTRTTDVL